MKTNFTQCLNVFFYRKKKGRYNNKTVFAELLGMHLIRNEKDLKKNLQGMHKKLNIQRNKTSTWLERVNNLMISTVLK